MSITSVTPLTVEINKTIDVTIGFRGDGWAMQPTPVDVVLTTDRSGSMLKDYPDRMVEVMSASHSFISNMDVSPSQDHIGLVSFGEKGVAKLAPTWTSGHWDWSDVYGGQYAAHTPPRADDVGWWWVGTDTNYDSDPSHYSSTSNHQIYLNTNYPGNPRNYADYATLEQYLSSSALTIDNSINRMVPAQGIPMRLGIYTAIKEMIANGTRPDAIRAIISTLGWRL